MKRPSPASASDRSKISESASARAQAASKRGVELLDAGDAGQACAAFREATEAAPEVAAHHVNLAYALQESGRDAESAEP
ncbi:MAG: hypothetical protein M3Z16_07655, partial [Pseudomonadota bacterium]|nr:hypothetical protein [Pseudomonadota bacterium]